MKEEVINHLGVSVGNLVAKMVEGYGTRRVFTEPRNRKIFRGVLGGVGTGVGLLGASERIKEIPPAICYALTAIGSQNLIESALGYENILGMDGITGMMRPEELEVTMPDVTRLRSKVGAMSNEIQRLNQENATLRGKIGKMRPDELIKMSPGSTAAGNVAEMDSNAIMKALGTQM